MQRELLLALVAGLMGVLTTTVNPASAESDESPPPCTDLVPVDSFSDEHKIAEEADGTSIYAYTCADALESPDAAGSRCWNGRAWKVWKAPAGNAVQRLEIRTYWCGNGRTAKTPAINRIYGNGYWGWNYEGVVDRNRWPAGYYSYAEVAGRFEHCFVWCEGKTRWIKVRQSANGGIRVV